MAINWCRGDPINCVVLDTNVLMSIFLKKVDITEEIKNVGIKEILIPRSVIEELHEIKRKSAGKDKLAAIFALKFIDKSNFKIIGEGLRADDEILHLAKKYNCAIITNDKFLKNRARNEKIPVGFLREFKKIEFYGI